MSAATVCIALDAMGGDYGPPVVVPAALETLKRYPQLELILVGKRSAIEAELQTLGHPKDSLPQRFKIQDAAEVVEMGDPPAIALRAKRDSSMRVAIDLVKQGTASACVSAGNTGALMAIARFVLKTLPGIDRPAIVYSLPSYNGHTHVLDLGANVDCRPEDLFQFAVGFPIVSRAISFVSLVHWQDRKKSSQDLVEELGPKMLYEIPGLLTFPINPPSFGQSDISQPIEVVLQTTESYQKLKTVVDHILARLKQDKLLENLDVDLHLNTPQLKVSVDRNKISMMKTTVEDVSRTIESLISGRQVTRYKRGSDQFDVIVQVPEQDRMTPENLLSIYVRGTTGEMIPLSNLITLEETVSASELNHFNKLRSATITASLSPGIGLSQGLNYIEKVIEEIAPPSYQIDFAGTSREYKEAQNTLFLIFGLAICFIYLVLAAQFESFTDPLVILISVPLAMSGALLALKLSGGTLNIYSQIGLITLIGLITKHGILIVEFANQLKNQGIPLYEAIIQASTLRLRPILMTTAAMILGAVPLAFASGAGAEARQEMGWVIVGGLLIGTAFTLFVVPVVYSLFTRSEKEICSDASSGVQAASQ